MQNQRDSFIFYRSFYEAINDLSAKDQLKVYQEIANYSLNFEEKELSGLAKTIFTLIKPQLNANNKRFFNGKLGADHGKKGGRPKKPLDKPLDKPLENPKETPSLTPNKNVNVNVNDNVNNNKEKDKEAFQTFWENYTPIITNDGKCTSKGSRKPTLQAYEKALKNKHTHETMLDGLESYLERCKKSGTLTCAATTFLNQERFLDEDEGMIQADVKQSNNSRIKF